VLLRVASGLLRPTQGLVTFDGPAASVGYVSPAHRCPDDVTARAWLDAMAALHGRAPGDVDAALDLTDLGPLADAPGRALSLGERRRLELARALLHDPALLLLDDPSLGLDPAARDDLTGFVETLASLGKAVLVASSQPEAFAPVCARVLTLGADRRLAPAVTP
jgi:ABC-2 type transport system ATP-binding protein